MTFVVNILLLRMHANTMYDSKLVTVVWDAIQGLSASQSLRLGVVGWMDNLLSLSISSFSYMFPYFHAYLEYISNRKKGKK